MRGDADMKGRIARKLKSRAGESIAETLIGLLIASLALVMLAGAISTATRLVVTSKAKMDSYYVADGSLAQRADSARAGNIATVTLTGESMTQAIQTDPEHGTSIQAYKNDTFESTPVYSYSWVKTGG